MSPDSQPSRSVSHQRQSPRYAVTIEVDLDLDRATLKEWHLWEKFYNNIAKGEFIASTGHSTTRTSSASFLSRSRITPSELQDGLEKTGLNLVAFRRVDFGHRPKRKFSRYPQGKDKSREADFRF